MKAEPPKVEPKGWGDNAPKVTLANLQQREHEIIKMSISTQRHDILYISKLISHMHQEV
jgi:hypothetical protein